MNFPRDLQLSKPWRKCIDIFLLLQSEIYRGNKFMQFPARNIHLYKEIQFTYS